MKLAVIFFLLASIQARETGRPYQGYDDLGDVTPTRGIVLEHPPGDYGLFMIRARAVFDTANEISLVMGTNVLTLRDFSGIKSNGPVEVLIYSCSDGRQDHSETNLFRVNIKRPAMVPSVRSMILETNQTRKFQAPSAPVPQVKAAPNSGPLPVSTPEIQAEGRMKMRDFYSRPPRRGGTNQ